MGLKIPLSRQKCFGSGIFVNKKLDFMS